MRGCLITGTDTGAGKTVVAAAVVARLMAGGQPVRALKPLITGLDDEPDPIWPPDHVLLAAVAGQSPDDTVLEAFGPPVSPHLAVQLAGARPLSIGALAARIRAAIPAGSVAVVEGVGGLLVPLSPGGDVRALAAELALPLVVAARPGLGTINHTLLTLEAARSYGLTVAGVVLTPWPEHPDRMLESNRETIETLGAVEVAGLAHVDRPDPAALAQAAASLPLDRWLT